MNTYKTSDFKKAAVLMERGHKIADVIFTDRTFQIVFEENATIKLDVLAYHNGSLRCDPNKLFFCQSQVHSLTNRREMNVYKGDDRGELPREEPK